MEKLREIERSGLFVKFYKNNAIIEPISFLEGISQNGAVFNSIHLEEDAEFDMKMQTGDYTLEYLKANYKKMRAVGIPFNITANITFNEANVRIFLSDSSPVVYIETDSKELEIDDLIEKKTQSQKLNY